MNTIEIRNQNLWNGQIKALRDISLDIPSGAVTAFIGPSGCGKSTLLKCLNRMNDLVEGCRIEGSILLDGDGHPDVRDIDPNILRRRVGMVFKKPYPFPMSI